MSPPDFIMVFLVPVAIGLILYMLADFIAYNIALSRCLRRDEFSRWLEVPNRFRIGSGFRLLKQFPK